MIFGFFAIGVAALFFVGCLIMLDYGRRLGLLYLRRNAVERMVGLPAVESAVFALIGLLIAFAVSGALHRFDERRQLVIQEANAISTTYDRLGLFERGVAQDLQTKLKAYVSARIELYRMPHDFSFWEGAEVWSSEQQDKILGLKTQIWDALVAACPQDNFRPVCTLSVTALSNALEAARLRLGAAERHPPQVLFVVLFGLGLGASLLAGFGMAPAKERSWIHMVVFSASLAITLYVITDIEFPRLGLIRIEGFDHFLVDAFKQMR